MNLLALLCWKCRSLVREIISPMIIRRAIVLLYGGVVLLLSAVFWLLPREQIVHGDFEQLTLSLMIPSAVAGISFATGALARSMARTTPISADDLAPVSAQAGIVLLLGPVFVAAALPFGPLLVPALSALSRVSPVAAMVNVTLAGALILWGVIGALTILRLAHEKLGAEGLHRLSITLPGIVAILSLVGLRYILAVRIPRPRLVAALFLAATGLLWPLIKRLLLAASLSDVRQPLRVGNLSSLPPASYGWWCRIRRDGGFVGITVLVTLTLSAFLLPNSAIARLPEIPLLLLSAYPLTVILLEEHGHPTRLRLAPSRYPFLGSMCLSVWLPTAIVTGACELIVRFSAPLAANALAALAIAFVPLAGLLGSRALRSLAQTILVAATIFLAIVMNRAATHSLTTRTPTARDHDVARSAPLPSPQ